MFSTDRILALDIGASKLLLAEFSTKNAAGPVLMKYAIEELQPDIEHEGGASGHLSLKLRSLIHDHGFKPAPLLMTLPGQKVFPRYVKLPPVALDKVAEMVAYEAEQNVPFPINEVVWDYQIIGDTDGAELNALLVAVKRDDVKELTDAVATVGLEPEVVDAAPMALYNAVRFNYSEEEGCTMVLDIGARSTNLVFIEGTKIFTRSIPVAGNTITQEIAKGLNLKAAEAEALKRQIGFVALGGVYAMTDDDRADRISKVIRNVVTRLHAEVNRSINFYRSQQGGTAPQRVLLTGGTALMPHMDTFFREKLQVDVAFFNPFVNVSVDEGLGESLDNAGNSELMQLGGVVGLALRRAMHCPVEINLLPPDLVARKAFRRRIPYLALSAACIVLTMLCWSIFAKQIRAGFNEQQDGVKERLTLITTVQRQIDGLVAEQKSFAEKADLLGAMAINRNAYARTMESVRRALLPGMWLTRLQPEPAPGGVGYDRITLEGLGYEDELQKAAGEGAAARAIDLFLQKLVEGDSSPFVADGSRVQRTRALPGTVLREFVVEVRLRQPLGIATAPTVLTTTAE